MTMSTFTPTSGQAEAIRTFSKFMQASYDDWPVFTLCGYAGTGKTTLVKHLIQAVQDDEDSDIAVRVVAPTGKAASVLRTKGFDATTVHSFLYSPRVQIRRDDDGNEIGQELLFELKIPDMRYDTRLIVVDEASMVDGEMATDLRTLRVKILAIGDPFQLSPVRPYGGLRPLLDAERPDAMLTEVTRQAHDSPVLHLATIIRESQVLRYGRLGDSIVIPKAEASRLSFTGAAPFIVGLNRTRHAQNFAVRKLLGRSDWHPEVDDRLLCRRNDRRTGLVNGELHVVTKTYPSPDITKRVKLTIRLDGDSKLERDVTAWTHLFQGEQGETELGRMRMSGRRLCQELTYGYAITCHAAQGSEWPTVVVMNEGGAFGADRWRWLYTAITRASERVAVIS